ncbi:MAG: lipid-binding SYLF domain-containing protein [Pirellulaceae bacterium]|nr:lipid-binding SYLF domain-containing protein [Pirellulaceae bacterium]
MLPSSLAYCQASHSGAEIGAAGLVVIVEATEVLRKLANSTSEGIPDNLVAEASGIAIVPYYLRGAFPTGVSRGQGVLLTRDATGQWLVPEFITMNGGSLGWPMGVQATDLVLIVRSPQSIDNIRRGKLTLGSDASTAAGPIGRYESGSSVAKFQAEILTYSQSQGLFAGISMSGAALRLDIPATNAFYDLGTSATRYVPPTEKYLPPSVEVLVNELTRYTSQQDVRQPATSHLRNASYVSGQPLAPMAAVPSADARAVKLFQSVEALQAKVDEQWKQYFSLPPDWFSGRQLSAADVHSVLTRYETVKNNPQFAALRALPEFHQSIQELRALEANLGGAPELRFLPPPPNAP